MRLRNSSKIIINFILISTLFFHSCVKSGIVRPLLTTADVSDITQTSAISGGKVTYDGGSPVIARGVCWNLSGHPAISDSITIDSSGLGSFTSNISGLEPGKKYFLRAYATNIAGTNYGNIIDFYTEPLHAASLTTANITSVTQTGATSGGNIINDGGSRVTSRGVCWSTSPRPDIDDSFTVNGSGSGNFISQINDLKAGTTYYIRSYATNATGTSYGNELSFSTLIQTIDFSFEKAPPGSGFKMDGYWVWGGSMIKVGTTYHLFASRWIKNGAFPYGYTQNSEIVRATSDSPDGPFNFEEVVIGERESGFWDSNMAHNPTIHKIGEEYVLFYIGSDFSSSLRRIGYATSNSITGPWSRSSQPVINSESNNPALLVEEGTVKLVYRDAALRVFLAEANNYKGPYTIVNDNLWPDCKLEDFYLFKANGQYHIICEDNTGGISGHERWGVHIFSDDGINDWKKFDPVVVYDHDIQFTDNSVLHFLRRERPQLFIDDKKIVSLMTGVYDGTDSWCQPVKLKQPILTD